MTGVPSPYCYDFCPLDHLPKSPLSKIPPTSLCHTPPIPLSFFFFSFISPLCPSSSPPPPTIPLLFTLDFPLPHGLNKTLSNTTSPCKTLWTETKHCHHTRAIVFSLHPPLPPPAHPPAVVSEPSARVRPLSLPIPPTPPHTLSALNLTPPPPLPSLKAHRPPPPTSPRTPGVAEAQCTSSLSIPPPAALPPFTPPPGQKQRLRLSTRSPHSAPLAPPHLLSRVVFFSRSPLPAKLCGSRLVVVSCYKKKARK